ncbi:hypothetical protein A3A68_00855 [Candidatus Saccharibacteria bacterium RIFCSPLOWO2_01_FULL_48_13]|nr:MAG: hypothetical protein A2884_01305 [Candidatus Saccharibacteria bacterium RIFCSPHIGHO2_01_FULL_48_12]OGL36322.1 MAG: hypothetical protein A3F38_00745 [Candidatus Saccharibacteria bacterium RIFCSPHIGHO2_12_FULL_48_21]OGL36973.1 MAG: hypothetical protein A3A68_00855 [Candidatus Saccharibacteria bacterium RIFCSPLOWO2_01_FULL_48_13]
MAKEAVLEAPTGTETTHPSPSRLERAWRKVGMAAAIGAVALTGVGSENISAKESPNSLNSPNATLLERSYVDRPDEVSGPQVHIVVVKLAGGPDTQMDIDGTLERDLQNSLDWQAGDGRGDGLSLRLDTYQGRPDITYFQSAYSSDQLKYPTNAPSLIGNELYAAGNISDPSRKKLLGIVVGDFLPCGVANWPPNFPGNTALVSAKQECSLFSTGNEFRQRHKTYFHEIAHTVGAVSIKAPNSDGNAHSKETNDVMGSTPNPGADGQNYRFDVNHDDWWYDALPWMTTNHFAVNIDIQGQGIVSSDTPHNRYIKTENVRGSTFSDDSSPRYRKGLITNWTAESIDNTYRFAGWSGAGQGEKKREIIIDGQKEITATFEPIVNVDLHIRGNGIIKVAGQKACKLANVRKNAQSPPPEDTCHYEFKPGGKVEITAVPVAKNKFAKWLGSNVTKPSLKLTAKHQQDKELTAVFVKNTAAKKVSGKTG